MASLIRTAKPASDWTLNDLTAFNIKIRREGDEDFFGSNISDTDISDYPEGILLEKPDRNNPTVYRLFKYMQMAMTIRDNEESAVDDFVTKLFECIDYTDIDHFVCTRKSIRLYMCGQNVHAETDVCIMDENEILFLLQKNKSDPELQIVAEAIATFQYNNEVRERILYSPLLDEYTFPCLTMVGTYPTFYKIKVTKDLDESIRFGTYSANATVLQSFSPIHNTIARAHGMLDPSNREIILKAFKKFRCFLNF